MRRFLLLRSSVPARGRVRTRGSAAWMPPGGSLASALAFSKLVERGARGELAAANSLWGEIRSLKGVSEHFNSPGAAAALRAGLEREEKLSKAGRRRRAPIDAAPSFRAHRRHT